jgi:hypothetical protein
MRRLFALLLFLLFSLQFVPAKGISKLLGKYSSTEEVQTDDATEDSGGPLMQCEYEYVSNATYVTDPISYFPDERQLLTVKPSCNLPSAAVRKIPVPPPDLA